MATNITINNQTYVLPGETDNPPWGENISDILTALATVAANVLGTGDIPLTSFTLTNNQSSAANVTALSFDTTTIRSAIVDYSIYISTSTNEMSETGTLYLTYKSTAGTWRIAQVGVGGSNVVFSITNAGQVQYVSSNVPGSGYSGKMKFSAKSFLQA